MALGLNPYLQFDGNAREAIDFYHSVFGGELSSMTYGEGMGDAGADSASKIMHASLFVDRGFHLMAADAPAEMPSNGNGTVSLSSNGEQAADDDALRGYWEGLADGAMINLPLEQAPWGDYFGQLTDKFGVSWMVNITAPQQTAAE